MTPPASTTGYVDRAWWPRSRGLSTELPALLVALAARLGRIQQVSHNLDSWDVAPSRIDLNGQRIRLLVLPPETDAVTVDRTLRTASDQDNTDGIDRLPGLVVPHAYAVERWAVDGGRVRHCA